MGGPQVKRDTQRAKVYKAEGAAFDGYAEACKRLETVAEVEGYVKYVFGLKRVQDAFPRAVPNALSGLGFGGYSLPTVGDGRGRRRAGGTVRGIVMPKWSRKKWVVLHELAHTVSMRIFGFGIAGHGWEYCSTYLLLVRYTLGVEAHDLLKKSFKEHRVKFRAPRKRREISVEKRVALIERMAIARAAKAARELSL